MLSSSQPTVDQLSLLDQPPQSQTTNIATAAMTTNAKKKKETILEEAEDEEELFLEENAENLVNTGEKEEAEEMMENCFPADGEPPVEQQKARVETKGGLGLGIWRLIFFWL
jgi:hypothetical protein